MRWHLFREFSCFVLTGTEVLERSLHDEAMTTHTPITVNIRTAAIALAVVALAVAAYAVAGEVLNIGAGEEYGFSGKASGSGRFSGGALGSGR